MNNKKMLLGSIAILLSVAAYADQLYSCQDPKTGRKSYQDKPCSNATQRWSTEVLSGAENAKLEAKAANELRQRQQEEWQRKRTYEMAHPGTFKPEEYMTREEYAEYQRKVRQQQLEAQREAQREAVRQQEMDSIRQAAIRAEQRAVNAEYEASRAREAAERPMHCTTSGQFIGRDGFVFGGSTTCR